MRLSIFLLLSLFSLSLNGQTIAEKKGSFVRVDNEMDDKIASQLRYINEELDEKRQELEALYKRASKLYDAEASLEQYVPLMTRIAVLKHDIAQMQKMWREETKAYSHTDQYALWHQPETTIGQLVLDYGAADAIFLMPPEISGMRLSLNSSLPIPRESWGECLEAVLSQYGIGMRALNPYVKELYIMRNNPGAIDAIVDSAEKLDLFPSTKRVCFLLSPDSADPRGDARFLEKFSDPTLTKIDSVGGQIYITSTVEAVKELLKLYSFAKAGMHGQDFQLVSLAKLEAVEMLTILNSAFHGGNTVTEESSSLRIIPLQTLAHSLFLMGSKADIKKAKQLIADVEAQIEDPQEKTVFWYTTKHSDAEELAQVLARVYDLLVDGKGAKVSAQTVASGKKGSPVPRIQVAPGSSKRTSHKTADGQNNFIVDPKTGAIIMVVENEALPKIKELLKKLDVPKKMVQIEVLLLEKKVSNQNKSGLNLLRLAGAASNKASEALSWGGAPGAGILEFFISRKEGSGIPAYDLAYQFMLGQEDVQINASPSVTTINQTPATIAIVDEISIDGGADDKKNRIYSRAQYGITMEITPTINVNEEQSDTAYITLDTDITFDTTKRNPNDRPDVTRRHIKNHVRIADGETVILGGLRRKSSQDNKDSIPFLGDIPGIGKLFSHTEMHDSSTEMFVFITPKIIADPIEEATVQRRQELQRRPGDTPAFLHELVEAQAREKKRLFAGSLSALFGRGENEATMRTREGEYDGR